MGYFAYTDASGATRNRKTTYGDGTTANPDVAEFSDPYTQAVFAPVYGSASLAVTTALTPQSLITVEKFKHFALQLDNVGANLNALEISTNHHTTGSYVIRLNAASHFTAPPNGSILRAASNYSGAITDFTTLVSGGGGVLMFDFRDFRTTSMRIRATVASGTSTLNMLWSGQY